MEFYKMLYDSIIEKRKCFTSFSINNYWEKHHIVPKCLGGSNDESNLVLLTAREHYLVHWLLTKIYKNDNDKRYKTIKAFRYLTVIDPRTNRCLTSKQIEFARILSKGVGKKHSEEAKQKMSEAQRGKKKTKEHIEKIASKKRGKKLTEEHKQKISDKLKGSMRAPRTEEHNKNFSISRTGIMHTEETKQKISEALKGRIVSEETKQKIRESSIGQKRSEETKKNISEALKNRGPISEETRKKLSEALRKRHENAPLSKKSLKKQRKNLIDLILSFLY